MILQASPRASYEAYRVEIDRAVARVLESGTYILGDEVSSFECEFADAMGAAWAVGVASGTDALELALRAVGVREGKAVATVSHTAVATVTAIGRAGAYPLFVDIDPSRFCMSTDSLRETLIGSTGAIDAVVVVHLYGQPADLSEICRIADEFGVPVIEDCAQAHGAYLDGRPVGSWGAMGCFSFYPTKNLGGLGDGGAVIGGDIAFQESLRLLRQYGWRKRYISAERGVNSRLDELQAAILRVKLRGLEEDNQRRRKIAAIYDRELSNTSCDIPLRSPNAEHVFHQYVVMHDRRDELQEFLRSSGIGTQVHYPVPVHRQPAFCDSTYRPVSLENTERIAGRVVSLPMYPELPIQQVERVCAAIQCFQQ